jgi:hypothetical protein
MKHYNNIILFFALLLTHIQVNAQTVEGFKHDFTSRSWETDDKICVICHTPHNTTVNWPLWDYSIKKTAYTLYVMREAGSEYNWPEGTSKLCLSCHDGTIAVDAYGGGSRSSIQEMDSESEKQLAPILTQEHPISILYNGDNSNLREFNDPATTIVRLASTEIPVSVTVGMLSPAHKVECATCHDVHKKAYSDEEDHDYGLLVMKMTDDQLCLACHRL